MQDWDSRKPVPRKKKLYTTLQQQSQAQKRKKAKRRTAGTKHMGKPRLGVAGLMKYFKQLPEGKRKFGKGGVIKKGVKRFKTVKDVEKAVKDAYYNPKYYHEWLPKNLDKKIKARIKALKGKK